MLNSSDLRFSLQQLPKVVDKLCYRLCLMCVSLYRHKRRVSTAEAREYCESKGLALIETSALDDSNVDLAFEQLLEAIFQAAQRSGFKRGSAGFEKASPGQGVKVVLPSAGDAEQDSQQRARTQSRCCA